MMMKKKASDPFKKENKESLWKQMANPKEMHDKLIRFWWYPTDKWVKSNKYMSGGNFLQFWNLKKRSLLCSSTMLW